MSNQGKNFIPADAKILIQYGRIEYEEGRLNHPVTVVFGTPYKGVPAVHAGIVGIVDSSVGKILGCQVHVSNLKPESCDINIADYGGSGTSAAVAWMAIGEAPPAVKSVNKGDLGDRQ